MNWRYIITLAVMIHGLAISQDEDLAVPDHRITVRTAIVYTPVAVIAIPILRDKYDIYDSFAYRFSAEYFISDYFSIGPGFEYLPRRVNTDAPFSDNITLLSYYLDGRFEYPLTDSGNSYWVLGIGTGISSLKEKTYDRGTGFSLYGIIGLDIGLRPNVGLDLLYRYGTTRVQVNDFREYRFERSALQAGICYRFKL